MMASSAGETSTIYSSPDTAVMDLDFLSNACWTSLPVYYASGSHLHDKLSRGEHFLRCDKWSHLNVCAERTDCVACAFCRTSCVLPVLKRPGRNM